MTIGTTKMNDPRVIEKLRELSREAKATADALERADRQRPSWQYRLARFTDTMAGGAGWLCGIAVAYWAIHALGLWPK